MMRLMDSISDADAREEHIQAYQKIFHKIPYLKSYVIRFENDPEGLGHLSTFVSHGVVSPQEDLSFTCLC